MWVTMRVLTHPPLLFSSLPERSPCSGALSQPPRSVPTRKLGYCVAWKIGLLRISRCSNCCQLEPAGRGAQGAPSTSTSKGYALQAHAPGHRIVGTSANGEMHAALDLVSSEAAGNANFHADFPSLRTARAARLPLAVPLYPAFSASFLGSSEPESEGFCRVFLPEWL